MNVPAEPAAPPRRWRERLDFLELELAKASDPAQKFQLRIEIEEARARLAELAAAGCRAPSPPNPRRPGPAGGGGPSRPPARPSASSSPPSRSRCRS